MDEKKLEETVSDKKKKGNAFSRKFKKLKYGIKDKISDPLGIKGKVKFFLILLAIVLLFVGIIWVAKKMI